LAHQCTTHK